MIDYSSRPTEKNVTQAAPVQAITATDSPWDRNALHWHLITPPLRPHRLDVAAAQAVIDEISATTRQMRALILGVTPELVGLQWPQDAEVIAVDASIEMIRQHWSPAPKTQSRVLRCSWESLPTDVNAMHVVLADGSLNGLADVDSIKAVIKNVHSALRANGLFVLRAFVRPEIAESPNTVIAEMLQGKISNVHVAKWRLAMAMHGTLAEGVRLHDIWVAFNAACERKRLMQLTQWSEVSIATIDSYKDVNARYLFPTLAEFRNLLGDAFVELQQHSFNYELGERCPTLVMTPRSSLTSHGPS